MQNEMVMNMCVHFNFFSNFFYIIIENERIFQDVFLIFSTKITQIWVFLNTFNNGKY